MEARDILAFIGRSHDFRDDLVERQRCGIDDPRPGRAVIEKSFGHERTRIKTDGATADQIASPHRDQIGRAGSGSYEMNSHEPSPIAIAQVTLLAAIRAPSSRALRPAATRAEASATDGTPLTAWTRNERVMTWWATRPRSATVHRTSGTERDRAALAIPLSSAFEVSVAMALRSSCAMPKFAS